MPRSGDVIGGRYRMIEPMASGGMGTVWRAHHTELEVDVALKMMSPDAAAESSGQKRFRREAQAGAQLKSPHIVHVHDFGIHEDQPYLAMELLQGQDLQARLDEGAPLPLDLCAEIVEGVAKAVQLAHDHGIIHRDLKPGNIFLAAQGDEKVPKVLDFGIAKDVTAAAGSQNSTTGAGILGSPAYMSPEQVWGEALDHTTDLWSLGVVAFEMVVGVHPFADEKLPKTFDNIIHEDIPKPSDFHAELSPFDSFFERAFKRDPKERIPSARVFADEFLDAVEAAGTVSFQDAPPKTKPPSSRRSARRSGRGRSSEARAGVDVGASTVDAKGADAETIDAPKPIESPVPAAANAPPPRRRSWTTAAILGVAAVVSGIVFFASSGPPESTNAEAGRQAESATAAGADVERTGEPGAAKEPAVGAASPPSPRVAPSTTATGTSTSPPSSPPPRAIPTGAVKKPAPPPASSGSVGVDPLFGIPMKKP